MKTRLRVVTEKLEIPYKVVPKRVRTSAGLVFKKKDYRPGGRANNKQQSHLKLQTKKNKKKQKLHEKAFFWGSYTKITFKKNFPPGSHW